VIVPLTITGTTTLGDKFQVVAVGTNPTTPGTTNTLEAVVSSTNPPTFSAPADVASPSVTYGAFVSGVAVTPSPTAAGATATYTVSFVSTDGLPATDFIRLQGPDGTAFSSSGGAVVTDQKTGATAVVTGTTNFAVSTTTSSNDTVAITVPFTINAGDPVTVMVFGVTNPAAGSYGGSGGMEVTTQVDSIPAFNATAYVIGSATVSSLSPTVTVSPTTAGALATYTIATFEAASNLVAGTDTIEVSGPTGTTFPATGYTLTDATTGVSQNLSVISGAYSDDVKLGLASNVAAGDKLSLMVTNVVNPITASSGYSISLGADTVSTNTTAAGTQGLETLALTFPHATDSFPNGAIIFFGGAAYVFAGGHPFGAPSEPALLKVESVDPAKVQTAASGATVPTTPAREGTLIIDNGTVYVVGTNGELYGFATPAQVFAGGFDAADVITVPSLGGLTVNSSTAAAAGLTGFNTESDGAIVNSGGTFFIFAGGKAFGIPTTAGLTNECSTVPGCSLTAPSTVGYAFSSGTVTTAMETATPASGVLVTIKASVDVIFNGNLYPFKGAAQLANDGYGGTPSILVPGPQGLSVAVYTGT
jgi:hypothetical protein